MRLRIFACRHLSFRSKCKIYWGISQPHYLSEKYLHHLLIRSESISSSWSEGKQVTPKRLAIVEALQQRPQKALDVVANVRATEAGILSRVKGPPREVIVLGWLMDTSP